MTRATTAAWAGVISLVPYVLMKTYWAFGGTAGKPAGDMAARLQQNGAPAAIVWMERHGLDFTVFGALAGMLLLAALVLPWGTRLPRWTLLLPGWTGAILLTPYGLATMIAAPFGFSVGDTEGWSSWVGLVGGLAFAGLGTALAICTHTHRHHRVGYGDDFRSAVP
ncbi:hypothetical protein AB0L25_18665 [Spirillospora sp. NPDC052242]